MTALIVSIGSFILNLILFMITKKKDRRDDGKLDIEGNQITFRDKDNKVFLIMLVTEDELSLINKERKLFFRAKTEKK